MSTPAPLRSPADLGALVRLTRKAARMTQADLAKAAGTGIRFLVDLEAGKVTCQVGKALHVLGVLGIALQASPPAAANGVAAPAPAPAPLAPPSPGGGS